MSNPNLPLPRARGRKVASLVGMVCLPLTALVLSASPAQAATLYSVATTGADTNPGTTSAPFRTIQKCASVATAGDVCEIQSGTYPEDVTPAHSGSSGNPIVFRPATGAQVTVSGTDSVSGWSLYSGHIYKAAVTLADPQAKQLFVNNEMMTTARWPNLQNDRMRPDLAFADSGSNTTTLVDSAIPTVVGGWNGATFHVWSAQAWMSATGTITSTASGSLGFTGANSECGGYLCVQPDARYYLEGVLGALDAPGEWYYDQAAGQVYFWAPGGGAPTGVTVKQRQTAFDLSGRSFIDLSGLALQGANVLTSTTSTDNVLDGLNARYISHYDTIPIPNVADDSVAGAQLLTSGIILNGTRNSLLNSRLEWSAGNGVSVQGTYNRVENNLISNVDYMGTWTAGVYVRGQHESVLHNTIFNAGRDGIAGNYTGDGIWGSAYTDFTYNKISYNEIFHWGMLNDDAGGIYTCCRTDLAGGEISYNYIHDNYSRARRGSSGNGIQMDNGSKNFLIHHNVIENPVNGGMTLSGTIPAPVETMNARIYNNTFLGVGQKYDISEFFDTDLTGSEFKNNIYAATTNFSGGTSSNNLPPATSPQYLADGPLLSSSSPAIDAGTVISGITDGYVGSAPDMGAFEFGGRGWAAGCSMLECSFATDAAHSIDDNDPAVTYTGTWSHCTTGCNAQFGTTVYDGTISYTATAGAAATITFNGVQAQIYGQVASGGGLANVSIDGGPAVPVDIYKADYESPTAIGDFLLYTTPRLSPGTHTITWVAAGNSPYGGAYTNLDRVSFTPSSSVVQSVSDSVQGSGLKQVTYSSGWSHCASGCNGGYGNPSVVFEGDNISIVSTADETATIRFYGTDVQIYGATGTGGGMGAIGIDGGAEQSVTWYRNTALTGNQLVYDSGVLGWGYHTIRVRATGQNGAGGWPFINLDRVVVSG